MALSEKMDSNHCAWLFLTFVRQKDENVNHLIISMQIFMRQKLHCGRESIFSQVITELFRDSFYSRGQGVWQ